MLVDSVTKTHAHAGSLARKLKSEERFVLLTGPLGVGKTEWVKGFVESYLKTKTTKVSSPTYSLINTYSSRGKTVHHVDLYRLKDLSDLESIGFWDLVGSGHLLLVEWGEQIPENFLKDQKGYRVKMSFKDSESRIIETTPI